VAAAAATVAAAAAGGRAVASSPFPTAEMAEAVPAAFASLADVCAAALRLMCVDSLVRNAK
jgi:hypothetical protein